MAKADVSKFFALVYENKSLQGALHSALVQSSPEVVSTIAQQKGFNFTKEELVDVLKPQAGELSDNEMEAVAGGAALAVNSNIVAANSLRQNFWGAVAPGKLGIGGLAAFGLGIPGPSFVHVMSADEGAVEPAETVEPAGVSATELYESLISPGE